jgi:sec-independent protein translocase protein TatB
MFDIGFWEITVIAVVALLVVGPKELPTLMRTASAVIRKVRRFVREAKSDLDEEIRKVDELKRLMAKEARIAELHKDIDSDKPVVPVNHSPKDTQQANTEQQSNKSGQPDTDRPPHGKTS